jgi:hypothetical protein
MSARRSAWAPRGPHDYDEGFEFLYEGQLLLKRLVSLGFHRSAWQAAQLCGRPGHRTLRGGRIRPADVAAADAERRIPARARRRHVLGGPARGGIQRRVDRGGGAPGSTAIRRRGPHLAQVLMARRDGSRRRSCRRSTRSRTSRSTAAGSRSSTWRSRPAWRPRPGATGPRGSRSTTRPGPPSTTSRSARSAAAGPATLENYHFLEKISHFDRERIPERVVHARGFVCYGEFEATGKIGDEPASKYTRAKLFQEKGKKTPLAIRFSTVIGGRDSSEVARDPRGFAVKFYTEDGNWDLVGNNLAVFFIRDAIKFPDVIHSLKPDPVTFRQEPNRIFDFMSQTPESMHMLTHLFSPRGIPASYRHMEGFGVNTYKMVNAEGERCW